MQTLSYRVAYFRVICTMLFMVIPSVAMATSFTFSTLVSGGGTFSGSFTVAPPPLDPMDFIADNQGSPLEVSLWSFMAQGLSDPTFDFIFDSTTNGTFFNQGVVVEGGILSVAQFDDNIANGFQMVNAEDLRIVIAGDRSPTFDLLNAPTISQVPEPTSIALFATGLLGLARYRWAHRRREGIQAG